MEQRRVQTGAVDDSALPEKLPPNKWGVETFGRAFVLPPERYPKGSARPRRGQIPPIYGNKDWREKECMNKSHNVERKLKC